MILGLSSILDSILSQSAVAGNSHFMVAARGKQNANNGQLAAVNVTQKAKVWDVQVYQIVGNLPSDYLDLIQYLYLHPYQPITAEMWA